MIVVKNLPASAGRCKRHGFEPWVGKIPRRRAQQPTPVFLLGESHGQRSLLGYSPWSFRESDTTEVTACRQHVFIHTFSKPLKYKWTQNTGIFLIMQAALHIQILKESTVQLHSTFSNGMNRAFNINTEMEVISTIYWILKHLRMFSQTVYLIGWTRGHLILGEKKCGTGKETAIWLLHRHLWRILADNSAFKNDACRE